MSRVALVGCGVIAPTYARASELIEFMELAACVDADPTRSARLAETHSTRALSLDELLSNADVDVVVNLTPPAAHAAVSRAALAAGLAVYSEKPLGLSVDEGAELVGLAASGGVRLGCAPDTFLGTGLQTARAAIDRGDIGEPLAANAFLLGAGPEWWHPNPEFFYCHGAGPLFDMGPYYITALVHLLGAVRSVSGTARISRTTREFRTDARRGERFDVTVPSHVAGGLEFETGPIATLVTSFDAWATDYRNIEVYGAEGTLFLPDPNTFDGPVQLQRSGQLERIELEPVDVRMTQQRGIGLADMLWAARTGRAHRASGELALHVLEVMSATLESAESGHRVELTTTCARPAPLPVGLPPNTFDD